MEDKIKGRLIRQRDKLIFLCSNGTYLDVDNNVLVRIYINFADPDSLFGHQNMRWDTLCRKIEDVPGETLAIITPFKTLLVYDSSAFTSILIDINPKEYITLKEFAEKHKVNRSRIGKLCRDGRIAGAVLRGGRWFIPKYAKYPRDARLYNGRKDKSETIF